MRLIIVRHGEPNYEKDCLTPLGHVQARAAAERLKDEGIEEVWTSPLGRARETAEYTAKLLGLPARILEDTQEIGWGSTDGVPIWENGHPWTCADEIMRRGEPLNDLNWREHPFFRNNFAVSEVERSARAGDRLLEHLGYAREGLYYRCKNKTDEQHTYVLFGHGGSGCAILGHIMNLPFPYLAGTVHMEHTAVTVLRFDRHPDSISMPIWELVSDSRHIHGLSV
ncbi:MAG: histidine phosphatase family protein [Clostridia bacterium]|nr:histidine phosphatase family protein [Clostridia bacterium]